MHLQRAALLTLIAATGLIAIGCSDNSGVTGHPGIPDDTESITRSTVAPPAPPTGFCASVAPNCVKLAWDPNLSDPQHAGFVLSRQARGASVSLIAEPAAVTCFIDDHPYAGVAVYIIHSVNDDGTTSPAVQIVIDRSVRGHDVARI